MTTLQEYNAIVNTAADLLAALDKLDGTNSSIHRSIVNKIRKDLKIQIIQCRTFVVAAQCETKPFKAKKYIPYNHLAR